VIHYHVDGFRFDLAAVLRRHDNGRSCLTGRWWTRLPRSYLASTKLIAEAWDAAARSSSQLRRQALDGMERAFPRPRAPVLAGRSGLLAPWPRGWRLERFVRTQWRRRAQPSTRDLARRFTLNDLVSYCYKHNEANGEAIATDNNNMERQPRPRRPTHRVEWRAPHSPDQNILATLLLSHGCRCW